MLKGCASSTELIEVPQIEVPEEALVHCDDPVMAEDGKLSTLLITHVELRGQYQECRIRHNSLINRIEQLNSGN